MEEENVVTMRCIVLGYKENTKIYAFPGVYRYRRNGNDAGQLFVDGNWQSFQPGEETAFKTI